MRKTKGSENQPALPRRSSGPPPNAAPVVVPPPHAKQAAPKPIPVAPATVAPPPAPEPALPILTRPTKGKGRVTNKVEMEGCECPEKDKGTHVEDTCRALRIDRMVERARQIESLTVEQKMDKQELLPLVEQERRAEEAQGNFAKTVILHGVRHVADITFKDSYSKMGTEHEATLRQAVGDKCYEDMFRTVRTVVLRNPEAAEKALREALGDKFDAVCQIDEHIKPQGEFMQKRAALRGKVTPTTDTYLDKITDQIRAEGSFNHKRSLNGNGGK